MKTCPICAEINSRKWSKKNGYFVYQCLSCTHVFVDIFSKIEHPLDTLTEDDFRSTITNSSVERDEEYYQHLLLGEKEGSHTSITYQLINSTLNLSSIKENRTWLDVGCGSGHIVHNMQRMGWDVVGIEPGEWGQIAAKDRQLNIIKGFLTRNTFDRKFDIVSATDVLEHQPNPYEFVELLKYYLKPKGVIILSFPFADSMFAKLLKSRWDMIAPPTHCQFFNKESLEVFASNSKLVIQNMIQYNSTRFRFFGRYRFINDMMDYFFKITNLGDQVVVFLKLADD